MSLLARGSAGLARAAGRVSRALGRGGGTTVPGVVLLRLNPGAVRTLAADLVDGSILVSATNGKTTTTRLIAGALRADGRCVVTNAAGANLLTGVAAALANHRDGAGAAGTGVFECDEAALPAIADTVRPRAVVLMNLFRDQLDRHGELEAIGGRWETMIAGFAAAPGPTLVLCADDPLVAALPRPDSRVVWFGIDDPAVSGSHLSHSADSTRCRICSAALVYDHIWIGHLGAWRCPSCESTRPPRDVSVIHAGLTGGRGANPIIRTPEGEVQIHLTLPGLHNVLNAAAALAGAIAMGVSAARAAAAISEVPAAFGRAERVTVDDHEVVLLLAKNPTGTNENVRTLLLDDGDHDILVALNDQIADGRDVSWIWDVDFEPLLARTRHITVTGDRAHDLALRFKYAGMAPDSLHVEPDPGRALDVALGALSPGGTLTVFPTYTAMHQIRAALVARGAATLSWDEA